MRHITPLALLIAITLSSAPSALAQEDSKPSFAQRLASLRLGWGSDDQEQQDPRAAIEASAANRRAGSAEPDTGRSRFASRMPRLNPSDLLPGDMFAGSTTEGQANRRPTSAHLRHTAESRQTTADTGSARSRIIRDLRVQSNGETGQQPRVASREPSPAPQATPPTESKNLAPRPEGPADPVVLGRSRTARAGSVLSPAGVAPLDEAAVAPPSVGQATAGGTAMVHEADLRRELLGAAYLGGGSNRERADDATARSIAAAVASSMAAESVASEDQQAEAPLNEETTAVAATPEAAVAQTYEPETTTTDNSIEAILAAQAATEPAADVNEPEAAIENAAQPAVAEAAPQDEWVGADREVAETRTRVGGLPVQAGEEQQAATPSVASAAAAPAVGASDGFEQEVAKRRFEGTVEQSIEPRTAAPEQEWNQTASSQTKQDQSTPNQNTMLPPTVTAEPTYSRDADLLMSQRMPQIVSRVSGPKQIIIGREAVYRVSIANRGDETADQLATTITVPEWAEVVGSRSTVGLVEPPSTDAGATKVLWKMAELQPSRTQHLDLKLVARQGRPIELGVNWKHAPTGSRTVVEVQEPKLAVSLDGPDEVLFGTPQVFRLHVSNPGTGPAEDVRVRVQPPGDAASAMTEAIGDLLPNESRTIEFKVTGAEAGELKLQAQAIAMGNLNEQASKSIFCRKPELEVDWRGPARKYAGASATYYFRVRNPGTATADGVEFRVNLPAGFEVSKASGNGRVDTTGRQLRWGVGSLRPGDDYYMELQGVISQPGVNEFAMGAADADRRASATTTATTEVIALADLKLEIRDPKGPLPVGGEVVYEVRVRNRGSNSAQKVKVVGLFSEGIEPYRVEGAEASIADGRVAVRTIDSLTIGSELVLMIHAKATRPGAHIFRAEVLCQDLDIKLAAEETTRFYAEEQVNLSDDGARSAGVADRFSAPR
ncbi:Large cysteine-rich periplasmic protein OmcB [Posidoniimonas polymericola]|uniref:Large cysteine-rich periplasmic protein OmcB n=1 Tax=Posidoniimonas polymericola TaxID=2528002 RepID=A0A5C5XVD7_9BACT|nr:DUF11 domain-containing protein [Posidoniimonas polymericola]TWT66854.1 Large cysteine-rich periplasmic protein OmcB [Posidoniimonas polymericola]